MSSETFSIEGFGEIEKALDKLDAKVKRRIGQRSLRRAITPLRDDARSRVNVKTGNLRKSIKISVKKISKTSILAQVKSTAPHAHLVEYGHNIVMLNSKTGKKFSIGKRTREFPFLTPAFDQNVENMLRILEQELREALEI